MCAADMQRPTDRKSTRIYHSHSRSRQLLSLPLPLSPTNFQKPTHSFPLHKTTNSTLSRFGHMSSNGVRMLFLVGSCLIAFALLQSASRPLRTGVGGIFLGGGVEKTVIVSRPELIRGIGGDGGVAVPVSAPDLGEDNAIKEDKHHLASRALGGEHKQSPGELLDSHRGIPVEGQPHTGHDAHANHTAEALEEKKHNVIGRDIVPVKDLGQSVNNDVEALEHPQRVQQGDQRAEARHSENILSDHNSVSDMEHLVVKEKHAIDELDKTDSIEMEEDFRDPANFTTFHENTALNYFHLHKTGGVSFKERLFDFFLLNGKFNRRGEKAVVVDTCHISGSDRPALGIEAKWSCDWGEIGIMPENQRNKIDVVVGHQYWERGAGYWLPNRDLRCFTVMRHPLHRKVSFFYHFFVRNAGRDESSVTKDELIQFVLGKKMPESPLIRDAGPGYYASRLWSDGVNGYTANSFVIEGGSKETMIYNSIRRLRRNFVFIGLQTQEKASLCMLKRTVQEFAKAHGFNSMGGLDDVDRQRERLNTGSYALSAKLLWDQMSEEQQNEFKRVEEVDLEIYRESVKMFGEMVHRFGCDHLVVDSKEDDIAL